MDLGGASLVRSQASTISTCYFRGAYGVVEVIETQVEDILELSLGTLGELERIAVGSVGATEAALDVVAAHTEGI